MINQLYFYWLSKLREPGKPPDFIAMDSLLEILLLSAHLCILEPVITSAQGAADDLPD
jgi:hypothetical protein